MKSMTCDCNALRCHAPATMQAMWDGRKVRQTCDEHMAYLIANGGEQVQPWIWVPFEP